MITITDNSVRQINAALLSLEKKIGETDSEKAQDKQTVQMELKNVQYNFMAPLHQKGTSVGIDTTGTWEGNARSATNAEYAITADNVEHADTADNATRTTQIFDRFIAYSTTAAETAAKVASCDNYDLRTDDVFVLIITTSNTASSELTLNVNNRGAKTIYINGTVSSSTNKTLNAGTYFVYYNGTNYYLRTDGKFPVPFTASDVGAISKSDLLDFVYPVGSLYISENPTDPKLIFGGVWEKLPDGVFIRNSGGNAGEVGQIQPEGLPNIIGRLGAPLNDGGDGSREIFGAYSGSYKAGNSDGNRGDTRQQNGVQIFNASNGETKTDGTLKNDVYGKSDHVTPYNISFHMWKRTA